MTDRHDRVGRIIRDTGDRVGAAEIVGRTQHGLSQPVRAVPFDQMSNHFGVGLGPEAMTFGGERAAELAIILDDPVVNNRQARSTVEMRMRIDVRGTAMRRPPRMRYSGRRMELASVGLQSQIGDTRRRDQPLENRRCAAIDHGKAGGIVAAIFEPPDAFDQDRNHVASRCRADYAAHVGSPTII